MTTVQVTPALITIDGVTIGEQVDGAGITFNHLGGWYDGPGSRSNFTDRRQDHGSHDGRVYRTARVITISGFGYADTRAEVAQLLHRLSKPLAEGQLGAVTVDDPDYGPPMTVMARLTDGPLIGWDDDALAWTWQMQVTAPDPRKYAAAVSESTGLPTAGVGGLVFPLFDGTGKLEFGTPGDSGQVSLSNPGTADTYLTFEIAGPVLGGVALTDVASGRQIVYGGDVPSSGVLLVIDSALGRASLNGSDRTGELTVKQWWAVKAGESSTVQFSTLGALGQSGQLTATIRPAYW